MKLALAWIELTCGPGNEVSSRAGTLRFVREGVMAARLTFKASRWDTVLVSPVRGELVGSRWAISNLGLASTVVVGSPRLSVGACQRCMVTDRPCCSKWTLLSFRLLRTRTIRWPGSVPVAATSFVLSCAPCTRPQLTLTLSG